MNDKRKEQMREKADKITQQLVYVPDSFGTQVSGGYSGNWNIRNIEIIEQALLEVDRQAREEAVEVLEKIVSKSGDHRECPVDFCVDRIAKEFLAKMKVNPCPSQLNQRKRLLNKNQDGI